MIYTGENEITVMLGDMEIPAIYAGDLLIYPTDFGTVTGITLEDLEWVDDVPYTGGTATADNCSFKVMAHYDSGKSRNVKNKSTVTGSLVVPASTAETREYVGVLTLTASYEGFTASDSVDVYQSAMVTLATPLTFDILSDGYINWLRILPMPVRVIQYSKNGGEWTTISSTTQGTHIDVVAGDKVEFRGDNTGYGGSNCTTFNGTTCQFRVYGNIMSLINSTDFSGLTSLSPAYALESLFRDCSTLVDITYILLPATSLPQLCYVRLFQGTSITTAPPDLLPATTLASGCYQRMFEGCKLLESAPELPATTLTSQCYRYMFSGCTNLNYIKCSATSGINSTNCDNWVNGVQTVSGTFVKAPSASWSRGTSAVPNNWTIIDAT